MSPQISVVITNYNYGKYLSRCIRSLLDQSLRRSDYEIIVVDDGSTDNSLEILELFSRDVTVVALEENSGLSVASNSGLRQVRTRYVVRVDSDDYVHPKFLEHLLLGFELFGADFEAVSCDYFLVTESGKFQTYGSQSTHPLSCGIAFKFEVFERLGFYNEQLRIYEEVDFMRRFIDNGYRIFHSNMPLYRYVKHGKSLTDTVPK